MNATISPQKRRIAFAILIATMLLFTGSGAIAFWQNWVATRVADLPPFFWILCIINIIVFIALFMLTKYYLQTPVSPIRQTHPFIAIVFVFLGISQLFTAFSASNPTGATIFLGFVSIVLILTYGNELIRYIRTRLNKQQDSSN